MLQPAEALGTILAEETVRVAGAKKQVAIIYLGTQGLLREVLVRRVKEFEEHFLMEMENKLPDVMAEFKKGNLPEDGMRKMMELANGIIPQYKS